MLCEKCRQREAQHHHTVYALNMTKTYDLCEECWKPFFVEIVQSGQFLIDLAAVDTRYLAEAYLFVREALVLAFERAAKGVADRSQVNVTSADMLESFRQLALARLGREARPMLAEWGLRKCQDVGEIVFKLVEIGYIRQREKDRIEDFTRGYSFDDAFPES
jgi:uncharacterized repeat protein (TIGR04138 family)